MANYVQIKNEYAISNFDKCKICLASNRKLSPLENLATVYQKFLTTFQFNELPPTLLVCWECRAILRRFQQFQMKVSNSELMLQYACERKIDLNESLSTLNSTIITEKDHKLIYFNEEIIPQLDVAKSEIFDADNISDDFEVLNDEHTTFVQPKSEIKTEKSEDPLVRPLSKNVWARRRAVLNKKAKYRLIPVCRDDKDRDAHITKVGVSHSELIVLLEKERNSPFYLDKPYKCDKCILGFNSEKCLLRHRKSCHDENIGVFICDICQRRLPKKSSLESHCRSHYYKYVCSLCDYQCCKRNNQYWHMREQHGNTYQCLKCSLNFWCPEEFFNHYKGMHDNFVCDYCGVRFKMRYCIKKHIRRKHCPLKCDKCKRKFARYNSLWLHNKLKHPVKELERAYCVECNKNFDNIYQYKWHLNNSVRHKPKKKISIPCPGCDKVFTKNIYMKDHFELVHLKNYKYRCEQCDKNFVRNADLTKHTRKVHEGVQTPKNKICYVCGRGFSSNKILNNHIRTHTGERPFQCEYCTAKFTQQGAMTGHVRSVHFKQKRSSNSQNVTTNYNLLTTL